MKAILKMKKLFVLILLCACFNAASAQRATLDTLPGKIVVDSNQLSYKQMIFLHADVVREVFKSERNRSYIMKGGKRTFIYRREPNN